MPKRDNNYTAGYDQTDSDTAPDFTFSGIFGSEAGQEGVITTLSALDWIHRSPVSLAIDAELTEDEWIELIRGIEKIKRRYQWYLGDAMVYGIQRRYGETEDQIQRLVEITGKDDKTLHDYYKTALLFEISERSENLEFEQHRILAREFSHDTPEDRAERLRWLHIAETDSLSGRRLKTEIAKSKLPAEVSGNPDDIELLDGVTMERVDLPPAPEEESQPVYQTATIKEVKKQIRQFVHHVETDTLQEMPLDDLYLLKLYIEDKYNQRRRMAK